MPDLPNPYNLRDWKKVARQYDSMVYDVNKSGLYFPLSSIGSNGINYPENKTIQLKSYIGSPSFGNEAINILPSLVGASLVGIDKSNQYNQNWILLSQDFFNKKNSENIYLNSAGATSGNDWWYDVMPNVFFFQLYDLYPKINAEQNIQFASIADRFLESIKKMGGVDTPWRIPDMNYRAWKFNTMQGNPNGVKEPEAAGAYAWIQYQAYARTHNKEYLKGAEWAMEFFNSLSTNPSYELQLPYGTYTAARMNAEIGTSYDITKMINWSFDKGPLRGWGTITGNWGGFDVSGLVGEANDGGNDYAFQLNGVQQAAALLPLVRYDKRFAKAIGKWILNLANATRLFYPGFLPNQLQDASTWSNANDPNQVIGYEALREKQNGLSPVSTGDALKGGWAATNLSLYSTSSIGYLGSLIEKTNVEKILKLDVLKTDFFHDNAYPTYLLYNPFNELKSVAIEIGNESSNIYDAISESFLAQNKSGVTSISIPPNQAILISITPANGTITYVRNKMMIADVVVDYQQSKNSYTKPIRIKSLAAVRQIIQINDSVKIYATIENPNGNTIYSWNVDNGFISGLGDVIQWHSSDKTGTATVSVKVADNKGNIDSAEITLSAVSIINLPPVILAIDKSTNYVSTNGAVMLTCFATDPNKDSLTYNWTAPNGTFINGMNNKVTWTAPNMEGIYSIFVSVRDSSNLTTQSSITILVKNFSTVSGNLIAYYPFNGNADDLSGNQLHGQGNGIAYVPDKYGSPNKACYFNGGTQNVKVTNSTVLNVQNAITVACWFNAARLPDYETFLLSHGSWQNRWKISFTPDKTLRWTVNTVNAIADLDTPFPFIIDSFYYVTASYDGSLMVLYINGELIAYKSLTGLMHTSSLPFLMGQMLPDNTNYNFKGVIDEVKLFDFAMSPVSANSLYQQNTTAFKRIPIVFNSLVKLSPNPAANELAITFPFTSSVKSSIKIFDIQGRLQFEVNTLSNAKVYKLNINNLLSGVYYLTIRSGLTMASAQFVKL
ncbi:MAG: LamG-like jellyroll fold domain-containing protein [Saprospiraceae bacterium]